MSRHDDDKFDDSLPTKIDPEVPTGARARPAQFDPHARLKDNRTATPMGGRPVAAEVISALPPVRHDDPVTPRQRAASNFDPTGRIDDSSRTKKWAAREGDGSRREGASRTEAPTLVEGFHREDDAAVRRDEASRRDAAPRMDSTDRPTVPVRAAEDPARRAKAPTRRGHDSGATGRQAAQPVARGHDAGGRNQHPRAPTPLPIPPGPPTAPMRAISMKTPADHEPEDKPQRVLPAVKLRAISDLRQTPPHGMGNLAPPFDPREARSRRFRDNVIWGSLAVILASIVTLAIWFLARR